MPPRSRRSHRSRVPLPPSPAAPGLRHGRDAPAPRSRGRRRRRARARRSGNGSDWHGSPGAACHRPPRPRFHRSSSRCRGPSKRQPYGPDSGLPPCLQDVHPARYGKRAARLPSIEAGRSGGRAIADGTGSAHKSNRGCPETAACLTTMHTRPSEPAMRQPPEAAELADPYRDALDNAGGGPGGSPGGNRPEAARFGIIARRAWWLRWSTRRHLVSLVLAVLVPMLVFAWVLLWHVAQVERRGLQEDAVSLADTLAGSVDRQLQGFIWVLQAVASSPALERGDIDELYRHAAAIKGILNAEILVKDGSG